MNIEEWNWMLSYFSGYFIAQVIGAYVIKLSLNILWKALRLEYSNHKPRPNRWIVQTNVLGRIEVTIYYMSLILLDFSTAIKVIAGWLALKTIPQFSVWRGEGFGQSSKEMINHKEEGKERYNIFLIGSSLQIIFAIAGWKISEFLYASKYLEFTILLFTLIISSVFLILYLYINSDDKLFE